MRLNHFKSIKVDFTQPIQQILGTNGAGKSSFLSELNPLPGDHKDFEKGGLKHIVYEHRGAHYETISDFTVGNKHSLIKDGIYLLKEGNAKMMSELITQEFGYTKQIRDLCLGKLRFTRMGPTERRQWFTLFPSVDYRYAISSYGYTKERLRDVSGTIKEQAKNLVVESSKLLKEDEIKKIQVEIHQTHAIITELLEKRHNPGKSLIATEALLAETLSQIELLSKELLSSNEEKLLDLTDIEELEEKIHELEKQLSAKDSVLKTLSEQYSQLKEESDILVKSGIEGIDSAREKLLTLEKEKNRLFELKQLKLVVSDPIRALEASESLYNQLEALLVHLPTNEDKKFNQQALNASRAHKEKIKHVLDSITQEANRLIGQIAHLKSHREKGETECPQCHHHWIIGFDAELLSQYEEKLEALHADIKIKEKELVSVEEEIQAFIDYGVQIRLYRQIQEARGDISSFWDFVHQEQYLFNNPNAILLALKKFNHDLNLDSQITNIDKECTKLNDLLKLSEQLNQTDIKRITQNLDSISLSISQITLEKNLVLIERDKLKNYNKYLSYLLESSNRLDTLLDTKAQLEETVVKIVEYETINQALKEKQSLLAIKEEQLSAINNQKERILYLEEQIKRLEKDQEVLKILVQELSPTEGLIAESMLGFIKHFTDQVNKEINAIWSYPLIVKSCTISEEGDVDLDYKFPLRIGEEDNEVTDISDGSQAMKEIIDYAFLVTAMQYLDLHDYPLLLDEFSASFDETHKARAIDMVKNILQFHRFTQLFIVSHHFNFHGAMSQAEVCVLNEENLTLNNPFNEHVTFN